MWDQANILDKGFVNGYAWVAVRYSNSATGETFDEPIQSREVPSGWPEPDIHRRLDQLNAMNVDSIKIGPVGPKPDPPPEPLPTQDDLDRKAFMQLCEQFKQVKAEVGGKLGSSTQADLDALAGQIKLTYKDEYAPLIVGLFF